MIHSRLKQASVMIASTLLVAACSSTQPDRVQARSGSVTFEAPGNPGLPNCYEVWLDQSNPLDGIGDVPLGQVNCYEIPNSNANRPLPWHYSVIITIIPAGTTQEQLLFSEDGVPGSTSLPNDGLDDYFSLT